MPVDGDRRFEIRQANTLLSAMVASSDDGIVEEAMTTLATLAGLSRVQAQIGLTVLKRHGRVRHERRGTRNRPGRFEIVSDEFLSVDGDDRSTPAVTPRMLPAARDSEDRTPATIVARLIRDSDALSQELHALQARLDTFSGRLRLLVDEPGEPGEPDEDDEDDEAQLHTRSHEGMRSERGDAQ
jgi:hypothetical protein